MSMRTAGALCARRLSSSTTSPRRRRGARRRRTHVMKVSVWQETQNVTVDEQGRFAFLLGAATRDGIPSELFTAGEPRWVGVLWHGQAEAPRYLLTAVPYALKASAADTLGGLPASAYQLTPAARAAGGHAVKSGDLISPPITPLAAAAGTIGTIAKFVTGVDLGDSVMFENSGRVGIGTAAPLDILHVPFTNTNGALTGIAVQNLGSTATSYS